MSNYLSKKLKYGWKILALNFEIAVILTVLADF